MTVAFFVCLAEYGCSRAGGAMTIVKHLATPYAQTITESLTASLPSLFSYFSAPRAVPSQDCLYLVFMN